MQVIHSWTGAHADALRQSLHMSNETFAEHLRVGVRTVANWRNNPEVVPQSKIQLILDKALDRAPDRAKAQFAALVSEVSTQAVGTGPAPRPADSVTQATAHEDVSCLADERPPMPQPGSASDWSRAEKLASRSIEGDAGYPADALNWSHDLDRSKPSFRRFAEPDSEGGA